MVLILDKHLEFLNSKSRSDKQYTVKLIDQQEKTRKECIKISEGSTENKKKKREREFKQCQACPLTPTQRLISSYVPSAWLWSPMDHRSSVCLVIPRVNTRSSGWTLINSRRRGSSSFLWKISPMSPRSFVFSVLTCERTFQYRCGTESVCNNRCNHLLPCGHFRPGKCGECQERGEHLQCNRACDRLLVCGHQCSSKHPCSQSSACKPCEKTCMKRCSHGHPC